MSVLRNELIDTQKVRTDLIKWKLILVSVILAAAFGFTASTEKSNRLPDIKIILCCIPFICAYVDLQCSALYLRIRGIAAFLRFTEPCDNESRILHEYEKFMYSVRKKFQERGKLFIKSSLQTIAIFWFSRLINIFVALYGVIASIISKQSTNSFSNYIILIFGILGILVTEWIFRVSRNRIKIIDEEN